MRPSEIDSISDFNQSHLKFVREGEDEIFGQYCLFEDQQGERYVELTQSFIDQDSYDNKLRECQQENILQHQNILRLINFTNEQSDELCGSSYSITQLYKFVDDNLLNRTRTLKQNNQHFSEEQLWSYLSQSLKGLRYLSYHGTQHQDIKPYNILINDKEVVKLKINPQSQNHSGFQRPNQKQQVFSLGICFVEAANVNSIQDIYFNINENKLQHHLNQVGKNYSPNFQNILRQMVNLEENQRPNFDQLLDEIDQEGQEFQMNHPPSQLQNHQQSQNNQYRHNNDNPPTPDFSLNTNYTQSTMQQQHQPMQQQYHQLQQPMQQQYQPMQQIHQPMQQSHQHMLQQHQPIMQQHMQQGNPESYVSSQIQYDDPNMIRHEQQQQYIPHNYSNLYQAPQQQILQKRVSYQQRQPQQIITQDLDNRRIISNQTYNQQQSPVVRNSVRYEQPSSTQHKHQVVRQSLRPSDFQHNIIRQEPILGQHTYNQEYQVQPQVIRQEQPLVIRQEPQIIRQEPQIIRQEPQIIRQEQPQIIRQEPTMAFTRNPQVVSYETSQPANNILDTYSLPNVIRQEPQRYISTQPAYQEIVQPQIQHQEVKYSQQPIIRQEYELQQEPQVIRQGSMPRQQEVSYRRSVNNYHSQQHYQPQPQQQIVREVASPTFKQRTSQINFPVGAKHQQNKLYVSSMLDYKLEAPQQSSMFLSKPERSFNQRSSQYIKNSDFKESERSNRNFMNNKRLSESHKLRHLGQNRGFSSKPLVETCYVANNYGQSRLSTSRFGGTTNKLGLNQSTPGNTAGQQYVTKHSQQQLKEMYEQQHRGSYLGNYVQQSALV